MELDVVVVVVSFVVKIDYVMKNEFFKFFFIFNVGVKVSFVLKVIGGMFGFVVVVNVKCVKLVWIVICVIVFVVC